MDATSGLDISTVGYCVGQYSYYICPAEAGHSGLLLTLFSIGNTESNDNDVQAPGILWNIHWIGNNPIPWNTLFRIGRFTFDRFEDIIGLRTCAGPVGSNIF